MNSPRPPRKVRLYVLERDDYRCIDCRRPKRLPESMLEVDHDRELQDGGDDLNDPANLVTRCIPHHQAKTQERRMAREGTPVKQKAATAVLPDRPHFPLAAVCGLSLVGWGAMVALHAYRIDQARLALVAAAVLDLALALGYIFQWVLWRRVCEAQRVYERLCKVLDTPAAGRRKRFKVKAWDRFTPVDVMIQPGPGFQLGDKDAETAVAILFARAIDCEEVSVDRARSGWLRLRVTDPLTAAEARANATQDAPTDDADEAETAAQETAVRRVSDALLPLVDGLGRVRVLDWWPGMSAQNPRKIELTYAPAAARAARDARAELGVLLADVCAPCARDGRWRITWEPARDRFIAEDAPDALAPVVPLPEVEDDLDLVAGPVIGVREDGRPWRVPLLHSHLLIAGATGAGKGSVLWGIIRGVSRMVADGRVRLWVIDPKGGMELGTIEPIAYRFATAAGAAELLDEAAAAMETQARRLRDQGLRKLEDPSVDMPLNIVVVDELAALTSLAGDAKERNAMNATMGRLLTQGRAVGFTVVGALQDPRQKNLDNRNLFPVAVALRCKERQLIDMVLGAGARQSGALCDLIPRALPGVGYVVADGMADTLRVRAAFVPDDEVARIARPARAVEHGARAQSEQLALDAPEVHRIAPHVRVTRADLELPTEPASELAVANDAPSLVRVADLPLRTRWILPDDVEPVTIFGNEPDPDEPDDRVELTYIYDGEHQERVASFERTDLATPV